MLRNPNESAARGNLADPEFVAESDAAQPAHVEAAVRRLPQPRLGVPGGVQEGPAGATCIDHDGKLVGPPTPQKLAAAIDWPNRRESSTRTTSFDDPRTAARRRGRDEARRRCRGGKPVHLHGHPHGKGDALRRLPLLAGHARQQPAAHGSAGRDRDPVHRLPRHARASTRRCRTTGPASYTSAPDGKGRNLLALKTPFGTPRFEVARTPDGRSRYFQNSWSRRACAGKSCRRKDTIDAGARRGTTRSRRSPRRCASRGRQDGLGRPAGRRREVRPHATTT